MVYSNPVPKAKAVLSVTTVGSVLKNLMVKSPPVVLSLVASFAPTMKPPVFDAVVNVQI